jgi:hypothetical protein
MLHQSRRCLLQLKQLCMSVRPMKHLKPLADMVTHMVLVDIRINQ